MDPGDFWQYLKRLVAGSRVIIERPKGSQHPRNPEIVYPQDYGYLEGTNSGDGGGIDVWVGASGTRELSALVLTVNLHKRDAEIKILLGCSKDEIKTILVFHNENDMGQPLFASRRSKNEGHS